jgi:hypothetical protein
MHVAAVRKLVTEKLTLAGDSKIRQFSEQWRIGYEIGQRNLADDINAILGAPPKGYMDLEPSLKTKAKNRYLDWREGQAKGDWKKLTAEEQAVWEGYVENNVSFKDIRQEQLAATEYEYGIQYFDTVDERWYVIGEWYGYGLLGYWGKQKDREEYMNDLKQDYVNTEFTLVKRPKAGRIENA